MRMCICMCMRIHAYVYVIVSVCNVAYVMSCHVVQRNVIHRHLLTLSATLEATGRSGIGS